MVWSRSRRVEAMRFVTALRPALAGFPVVVAAGMLVLPTVGSAETISSPPSRAYMGNPDLNQQRASGRASDEGVSRAVSGYRPQVSATASLGYNYINERVTGT